jgi:hypothetical protein
MPAINPQMVIDMARQRFQQVQMPAGADRTRFTTYINGMCQAINQALQTWRASAYIEGIRIVGPVATGGKLRSVPLDPLIMSRAPTGWDVYNRAIAAGVHNQFTSFGNEVSVPGLPWYPAFAAFPGPMAPPMPNVPCPLMSIAAVGVRHLREGAITEMIYNKLPNPKPMLGKEVAAAIAFGIEKAVFLWLSAQMVQGVLGKGPVPTFAPPYVPVGPVVGGDNIVTPGHIGG